MSQGVVHVFCNLFTWTRAPESSDRTTRTTTWTSPGSRDSCRFVWRQPRPPATTRTRKNATFIGPSFLQTNFVAFLDRPLGLLTFDTAVQIRLVGRMGLVDDDLADRGVPAPDLQRIALSELHVGIQADVDAVLVGELDNADLRPRNGARRLGIGRRIVLHRGGDPEGLERGGHRVPSGAQARHSLGRGHERPGGVVTD